MLQQNSKEASKRKIQYSSDVQKSFEKKASEKSLDVLHRFEKTLKKAMQNSKNCAVLQELQIKLSIVTREIETKEFQNIKLTTLDVLKLDERLWRKSHLFTCDETLKNSSPVEIITLYIIAKRMLKEVKRKASPAQRVINSWEENLKKVTSVLRSIEDDIDVRVVCKNKKENEILLEVKSFLKKAA